MRDSSNRRVSRIGGRAAVDVAWLRKIQAIRRLNVQSFSGGLSGRDHARFFMRTASYSELRWPLAATIGSVDADHQPAVITCDRGKPAAVLISVEDFASLEETAYLLRSPMNAERLFEAVADLDRGGGTERKIPE